MSKQFNSLLIRITIFISIITWIWAPEFLLWHVKVNNLLPETIDQSRLIPSKNTLVELGTMDLRPPSNLLDDQQIIRLAEKVLNGLFSLHGFDDLPISPVFNAIDLHKGSAKQQLLFASLTTVDYLLEAYRATGQEKYFNVALESIKAFSDFESSRFLDTGFLWNDHAIAARIPILIKFWLNYRDRDDFDLALAQKFFELIIRSGLLLAKPEHYSWRTGHGIIQNIALLQITAAFPFLQETENLRGVAIQRFSNHLPYYINEEGATLLHSAEYNFGGVRLFSMVMRLYTLNKLAFPTSWWGRYYRAIDFYDTLRRPDGTLPMFGDTRSIADLLGPPRTYKLEGEGAGPLRREENKSDHAGLSLYPEAGYAIWWYPIDENNLEKTKNKSQLVTTWSYFPGLGHKLADELSILVWANERNWITNVGYWPYGHPLRLKAESWGGSNAPHLIDESKSSVRTAKLTKVAYNDSIFYIEMFRNGPEAFAVKREVIQIEKNIWIVLDQFQDSIQRSTRTNWTFFPDLVLRKGEANNSFIVTEKLKGQSITGIVATSSKNEVDYLFGNNDPFAGWVMINETPIPANTVTIHSNSRGGWQLAVFMLQDSEPDRIIPTTSFINSDSNDQWEVMITNDQNINLLLTKSQEQIQVVKTDKTTKPSSIANLIDIPYPKESISAVHEAVQSAYEKSTRRVPLISYRINVSYLLLALFVFQELSIFVIRKFNLHLAYRWNHLICFTLWLAAGFWLTEYYLVAGK